ncbi:hypothetical protein CEXT_80801 [Caerostris extrusa]|uniref:Uncharacterized protein n=1 Tax=Caerostris extrusa TaxID=172846 RepID=A0AAV4NBE2_CAEEX|nr:hypothetical protein CEXT_80801 [Caerostris extrusa]
MRQMIHIHEISFKYTTEKEMILCPRQLVSDIPPQSESDCSFSCLRGKADTFPKRTRMMVRKGPHHVDNDVLCRRKSAELFQLGFLFPHLAFSQKC